MNIKITGKELKATDAIKNYIDTKAERIEKYFDAEDINLFVTIKKEGGDQVAEMQINIFGETCRAVTASKVNIDTGKVNVIYRLKDSKNFGLIEPEE